MRAVESSLASARIDDALAIAARLAEVAPDSADAQELLGRALIARANATRDPALSQADRVAAQAAYARAAARPGAGAGLLNAAGVTAQTAGDLGAAIPFFLAAERRDPGNAQHPLFAGLALHRMGKMAEAKEALGRAREVDPRSPWPIAGLSAIALDEGDPTEALALARQARELSPRTDDLRVSEAKALRKLGRHREILTLLLALGDESRLTEAITWEIAAAHTALDDPIAAARAWGAFAEVDASAASALEAAKAWDAARDPVQAESWRAVAQSR